MPELNVRKPSRNKKDPKKKPRRKRRRVQSPNRHKFRINAVDGNKEYRAQYSPREVMHTDLSPDWQEVPRATGKPLLVRGGGRLRKMSTTLTLGHTDYEQSVENQIDDILKLAHSHKVLRVGYGELESRFWRLANVTVTSQLRNRRGQITRATVDLDFTSVTNQRVFAGPTSGGKGGDKDKNKNDGGGGGGERDRPKFYRIRRGDTLTEIAVRFYGRARMWRRIADVNNIKHPRRGIEVGKRIRLP